LASGELPRELSPSSVHGFGLVEAIEMGRALGTAPELIAILAVEGLCFEVGAPMTPAVAASAEEVARLVQLEAVRLSGRL
jgi:hydrogenase maturation protease